MEFVSIRKEKELWRRSEGAFRRFERDREDKENEGAHRVPVGLAPSEKSVKSGLAPDEVSRLSSSYGDISFGVDKKDNVTLTVSQKRRHNAETVEQDFKEVVEERAVRADRGGASAIIANSHSRENSAICCKTHGTRSPHVVMNQIKRFTNTKEQWVVSDIIPFLLLEEKERLRALAEKSRTLREERDAAADCVETEKLALEARITEKRRLEKQMFDALSSTIERTKKKKTDFGNAFFTAFLELIAATDDQETDDEENNVSTEKQT